MKPLLSSGPAARCLLAALLAFGPAAVRAENAGERPTFNAAEERRIQSFGPWPPAPVTDPSNRASSNAAAIALGQALFFDPRLSADGTLSCATCHVPAQHWTDGRARAQVGAQAPLDRNTPALWNVGRQRWFGWDGASDSLWAQSLRPLLDRREMAGDAARLAGLLRHDTDLACRWRRAFGTDALEGDTQQNLILAGKALAAFQETLVSGRTPFDAYRDARAAGDRVAMARYPAAAERGLALFIGKGNCAACHLGPSFSNGEFADIGIPFFTTAGRVDPGRHGGIRALQASPYTLTGRYSDDATRRTATGTRHVELRHNNWGEFKVPGLRNVARTAPYMHNGSIATLEAVVRHYSELNEERLHADGEKILRRLDLTAHEQADLVAFLRSLESDDSWSPPQPGPCTE